MARRHESINAVVSVWHRKGAYYVPMADALQDVRYLKIVSSLEWLESVEVEFDDKTRTITIEVRQVDDNAVAPTRLKLHVTPYIFELRG